MRLVNTPDGAFDGREINQMNCMTLVNKSGTCGVQALIQGLGQGDAIVGITSHGHLAKVLNDLIGAGEMLVGVRTRWEASIYDENADETIFGPIRGMKHFPPDGNGGYLAEIQDPKTLQMARAFANISGWVQPEVLAGKDAEVEDSKPAVQTAQQTAPKPAATPQAPASRPVVPQQPTAPPSGQQQASQSQGGPPIPPRAARPRPAAVQQR